MKKIPKKAKIIVGVAVLAGAVGFGCFRVYQSHFNGTVAVYSASDDSISTSESNWRAADNTMAPYRQTACRPS